MKQLYLWSEALPDNINPIWILNMLTEKQPSAY
jgi:hypothetical protein